ncbi:hypothetical protein BT69DRAFT_1288436 [Atractiella rhizophila]|nr:hypothetical protein BT69DRAFT_1288436 [Atractiella rhizophila]
MKKNHGRSGENTVKLLEAGCNVMWQVGASQQNAATEGKRNKAPPRYRCNQRRGEQD